MHKQIIQYLKDKYSPKALIIHGSRLAGDAVSNSDYDIALMTDEPDMVRPEEFQGVMLDVSGVKPEESYLKAGRTPLWPCEVIYDDGDQLGYQLVQRTEEVYLKGPSALTREEIENRRNYTKRLLQRLNSRGADKLIRYYYLSDFYDRVIRYWFEFNGLWNLPVYKALPLIAKDDPSFYQLLKKLWEDEYIESAREIYLRLFGRVSESL